MGLSFNHRLTRTQELGLQAQRLIRPARGFSSAEPQVFFAKESILPCRAEFRLWYQERPGALRHVASPGENTSGVDWTSCRLQPPHHEAEGRLLEACQKRTAVGPQKLFQDRVSERPCLAKPLVSLCYTVPIDEAGTPRALAMRPSKVANHA